MPRIRTIKPSFTTSEDLSPLPAETHLFAAGLLCYADDEGYFNANCELAKAAIFPLRTTKLGVEEMFTQLSQAGFVCLGCGEDGRRYGHICKFTEHQRVNRPTPSKIKSLAIQWNGDALSGDGNAEPSQPASEASIQEVWDYYITTIGRDPTTYSFSPARRAKAKSRFDECLSKTNGDKEKAVALMKAAIDGLAASDWHMGRDSKSQGKKYCEWENVFGSFERMEKWWNQ